MTVNSILFRNYFFVNFINCIISQIVFNQISQFQVLKRVQRQRSHLRHMGAHWAMNTWAFDTQDTQQINRDPVHCSWGSAVATHQIRRMRLLHPPQEGRVVNLVYEMVGADDSGTRACWGCYRGRRGCRWWQSCEERDVSDAFKRTRLGLVFQRMMCSVLHPDGSARVCWPRTLCVCVCFCYSLNNANI